jgi:hypothetical protein
MPSLFKKTFWLPVSLVLLAVAATSLGLFFYGTWENGPLSGTNPGPENMAPTKADRGSGGAQSGAARNILGTGSGHQSGSGQIPSLRTVEDRQTYYDNLANESVEALWQRWHSSLGNYETQEDQDALDILSLALAKKLQHEKGGEASKSIYEGLAGLLRQPAVPQNQKEHAIALLGETATPEALSVLIDAAKSTSGNPAFRGLLLGAIEGIGDNRWDDRFHPELSPVAEQVWNQTPETDGSLLQAVALTMARTGHPDGVAALLKAAEGGQLQDGMLQGGTLKARIAVEALPETRNPAALPVLKESFHSGTLDNPVVVASGSALATLGEVAATDILLDWAKTAPDTVAGLAQEWFSRLWDPESVQRLRDVLKDEQFQSAAVKEALRQALQSLEPSVSEGL